ncbi:DUF5753 domain-containing protein [Streptomyces brevispora]
MDGFAGQQQGRQVQVRPQHRLHDDGERLRRRPGAAYATRGSRSPCSRLSRSGPRLRPDRVPGSPDTRRWRAVEIRLYEVGVIPGLLQTQEYASALGDSTVRRGVASREQADERIALVAQRQASLTRTPPPLVFAVLDESCLLRPIGGSARMDAQFARLVEFSELPNTVLQVAPFDMGVRRPMTLPVTVLTMPDRSLMSYAESANRGHLERDSVSVLPLLTDHHQLQAEALPRAASVAMISQLRKGNP